MLSLVARASLWGVICGDLLAECFLRSELVAGSPLRARLAWVAVMVAAAVLMVDCVMTAVRLGGQWLRGDAA